MVHFALEVAWTTTYQQCYELMLQVEERLKEIDKNREETRLRMAQAQDLKAEEADSYQTLDEEMKQIDDKAVKASEARKKEAWMLLVLK